MQESSDKSSTETIRARGVVPVILSEEFRWLYFIVVGFLALLGAALFALGVYRLFAALVDSTEYLTSGIVYLACGALAIIVAFGVRQVRRYYYRIQEQSVAEMMSSDLSQRKEEVFDRIQQARQARAQKEYERNLSSTLVVERLETRDMILFPRASWNLQPGVNVLLGRNGFGKSLILRSLAGVLQQEQEVVKTLFRENVKSEEASIEIELRRNGEQVRLKRNSLRFVESIGKVPLLAIPDSRFLDRSQESMAPEDTETSDLRQYGAYHFMYQKPYGSVVRALLYGICLDYWEHGKSFDLPVFEFLRECVKRLTGYDFRFHSIERKGEIGFAVRVLTEGNTEPIPLQYASQGTLSVLAMFGLIRRYVRATSTKQDDEVIQKGSAIVLIDEADAHLHPVWQQKFTSLLKDLFPNVQFILSAHSPLFVAGCWRGEVAVLRRLSSSTAVSEFTVEQIDRDFVGATAAELYQQVFEIEELDDTYLEYATKATLRTDNSKRINDLSQRLEKGSLSEKEQEELRNLHEENRRMGRAVEVRQRRQEESEKDLRIEELKSKLLKLETQLARESGDTTV